MKTNPNDDLMRTLRAARKRLRAQLFLEWLVRGLFIGAFLLVAILAGRHWWQGEGQLSPGWLVLWGSAALLLGLIVALSRRLPLAPIAALLDRRGSTCDRFVTALALTDDSPFGQLALRECRAFLAQHDFSKLTPLRVPAGTAFLLVPLVALGLLQWQFRLDAGERARLAEAAQTEAAATVEQLEQLARALDKTSPQASEEELKKIAEQLRLSADRLRAEKNGTEDAAKAALRELSQLESMLAQLQQAPAQPSAGELQELAKALGENDATKAAAVALQMGDLEEAAQQLEAAAQQEPTKEEAEKTLQQALERLAQQKQLSEALDQLAKQTAQQGGKGGPADKALQKLAQMLREKGRQSKQAGAPQKGGKPLTEQQLKQLLAAIQNMKFGEGGDPQPGDQGPPQGDGPPGQITIQSFAGAKPGEQSDDRTGVPSGQPGSERDEGTTATPFGDDRTAAAEADRQTSLIGRLGEGESLSQLLPTAGDTSKSTRRYKELYDAMAPAAADAVVQENIPLGSRYFIKRYFESIRPKE